MQGQQEQEGSPNQTLGAPKPKAALQLGLWVPLHPMATAHLRARGAPARSWGV